MTMSLTPEQWDLLLGAQTPAYDIPSNIQTTAPVATQAQQDYQQAISVAMTPAFDAAFADPTAAVGMPNWQSNLQYLYAPPSYIPPLQQEKPSGGGLLGKALGAVGDVYETVKNAPVIPGIAGLAGGVAAGPFAPIVAPLAYKATQEGMDLLGLGKGPTVGQAYNTIDLGPEAKAALINVAGNTPVTRVAGSVLQELLDPINIAGMALTGPGIAANLLGKGLLTHPQYLRMLAGGVGASEIAKELGAPDWLQLAVALPGGLAAMNSEQLLKLATNEAGARIAGSETLNRVLPENILATPRASAEIARATGYDPTQIARDVIKNGPEAGLTGPSGIPPLEGTPPPEAAPTQALQSSAERPIAVMPENIREQYPNAYSSWTKADLDTLREMKAAGAATDDIAKALGRQPSAIHWQWNKLTGEPIPAEFAGGAGGVPPGGIGGAGETPSGPEWARKGIQGLSPERIGNELRQATAGLDFSNALRQGLFTIRHGPDYVKGLASGLRGSVDATYALSRNAAIREEAQRFPGLFISEIPGEGVATVARREETFAGELFSNLPGYKQTARGNTLMLNEFRIRSANTVQNAWDRAERAVAEGTAGPLQKMSQKLARPNDPEMLAKYLNRATGRGTLGAAEGTWLSSGLGFGMFSPRYQASLPQTVMQMFNYKNPRVAIEAWKDISTSVGAVTALLAAADASGLADVNLDPRSSDFGKFKIGNTRIDPWRGYQQIATFTARALTGEFEGGTPADLDKLIASLVRSKASPLVGKTWDLIAGENLMGQPVGEYKVPGTGIALKGVDATLANLIQSTLPFGLQGMAEAAQQGLLGESLMSLPPQFFGAGVNTYLPSLGKQIDAALAKVPESERTDMDGKVITDYDKLPPRLKNAIDQKYPDIKALAEKRGAESGSPFAKITDNLGTAREQAWTDFQQSGSGRDYREALAKAGEEARIRYDQESGGKPKEAATPEQKLLDAYFKGVIDASGDDYELRDRLDAQFRGKLSPAALQALDANLVTSADPNYAKLKAARDYLNTSYWDKRDQFGDALIKQAAPGTPAAKYGNYAELAKAAAARNEDATQAKAIKAKLDGYISRQVEAERVRDPKTDALLYIYGYVSAVLTPQAQAMAVAWAKENGVTMASPTIRR